MTFLPAFREVRAALQFCFVRRVLIQAHWPTQILIYFDGEILISVDEKIRANDGGGHLYC